MTETGAKTFTGPNNTIDSTINWYQCLLHSMCLRQPLAFRQGSLPIETSKCNYNNNNNYYYYYKQI